MIKTIYLAFSVSVIVRLVCLLWPFTQQKTNNLFRVVENGIEQCCAIFCKRYS